MSEYRRASTHLPSDDSREVLLGRRPRVENPELAGRLSFISLAHVVDLSLSGIGLETREALVVDHPYNVHVDGPDLSLTGVAVWNRKLDGRRDEAGEEYPVFRSGLRFTDLPGRVRQIDLKRYLAQHSTGSLGFQLRDPRHRLDHDVPKVINTRYEFKVRSLGTNGMLVEMDAQPEAGICVRLELTLAGAELLLRGHVLRVSQARAGDHLLGYRVAIEFVEPSESQQQTLQAFVEGRPDSTRH